jgi:hypothetical protein
VRATAGFRRSDVSFGAFVVVHMTTSVPFQVNAIGTTLGVPSLATYAKRARSRLSISWLIGFFRISATSLGVPRWCLRRPGSLRGSGSTT